MPPRKKKTDTTVISDRSQRRLLEALALPGGGASLDPADPTRLLLRSTRAGVTLSHGAAPLSVAQALVSDGLTLWSGAGADRRLAITEAGRAHVRRAGAPAGADPFRAQHSSLAPRAGGLVDEGESPLAWLARRKDRDGRPYLRHAEIEAGERFRRDVERAQILQRVTVTWEAPVDGGSGAGSAGVMGDLAFEARRRFDAACGAMGAELAGLLVDVCGYLKGLETVECERGWPPRSGKVVLRIALARLAGHYGLASEAKGKARGKSRHWGAEDYRPSL